MRIPALQGIIDRRMLVNFVADPQIVQQILPAPFRPKIYKGKAVVGICLIRLKQIRPKSLPGIFGIASENGAHRIAVEWEEDHQIKEGVYITRRDSSSWINTLAGGRIFPGIHYRASFDVKEENGFYHISFTSPDGTFGCVDAEDSKTMQPGSVFSDLDSASDFFKRGSEGYSPNGKDFDGMALKTTKWEVRPVHVTRVASSFFEDKSMFPPGSITFDNALLMTGIAHEWESIKSISHCV